MATTRTREVDFGWWREADGRQARLSWVLPHGRLLLFHTNRPPEQLAAAISEDEAREFAGTLDPETDDVASLTQKAGEIWPF